MRPAYNRKKQLDEEEKEIKPVSPFHANEDRPSTGWPRLLRGARCGTRSLFLKFFLHWPMLKPNFLPFPERSTERLLLRKFTLADAAAVMHLRSNPDVMKYINRPLTLTVADAEAWITIVLENLQKSDGINWCICLKEEPSVHVGNIGLWRLEKENYRAEIGYMLEPYLHGQGIMHEAVREVMNYGFRDMKLHSVEGCIDPRNIASGKVLEKAGFVQEAYFKENYFVRDHFADTAVYSIVSPYAHEPEEASGKDS